MSHASIWIAKGCVLDLAKLARPHPRSVIHSQAPPTRLPRSIHPLNHTRALAPSSPLLLAPPSPHYEDGAECTASSPPMEESQAQRQHPDLAVFIRHLWTCLPPGDLQTAIYPALSSWFNPDEQVCPPGSTPTSRCVLLVQPRRASVEI
jgi:hypothetical protein